MAADLVRCDSRLRLAHHAGRQHRRERGGRYRADDQVQARPLCHVDTPIPGTTPARPCPGRRSSLRHRHRHRPRRRPRHRLRRPPTMGRSRRRPSLRCHHRSSRRRGGAAAAAAFRAAAPRSCRSPNRARWASNTSCVQYSAYAHGRNPPKVPELHAAPKSATLNIRCPPCAVRGGRQGVPVGARRARRFLSARSIATRSQHAAGIMQVTRP